MTAMSHTWVRHREHGGYWQCPDGALDAMAELGWEVVDPATVPPEPNPAVAERIAWEAEQAEIARAAEEAATKPKSTRAASRGESE